MPAWETTRSARRADRLVRLPGCATLVGDQGQPLYLCRLSRRVFVPAGRPRVLLTPPACRPRICTVRSQTARCPPWHAATPGESEGVKIMNMTHWRRASLAAACCAILTALTLAAASATAA